jgi:predicted dehydrogenase
MRKIRVGLVGTGFAGKFHLESLRRAYGVEVEVAGVTSRRAGSREAFGRAHGIPVFDDVGAMLPHVDLVDVCSPPCAHEEAILAAAAAGKHVVCEKPLTGYFGPPGDDSFRGNRAPKQEMLDAVVARLRAIAEAVRGAGVAFGYAENFVYAPSVQKEREIVTKTGAQILRMSGEESHNGSASAVFGIWRHAGGGSLVGKGVHPLGALLYLKRVEGRARGGAPIRPAHVNARTHELTRQPGYRDLGFIRTDYLDIEDYGLLHVEFDDGTVGDVVTCEVVLGGLYGYVEVFANNHRTRCMLSPTGLVDTYNPRGEQFADVYLVEKISTKEGWTPAAADEGFTLGYHAEMQDFLSCAAAGGTPQADLDLALDTIATTYAAYLSAERQGATVDVPRV